MTENIFDIILKGDTSVSHAPKDDREDRNLAANTNEIQNISTPAMFWRPNYLAKSAWIEHVPFAFWLIENFQPKTLVELGTHYGVSYFAFCQAVQRLGINTKCFAVDTWKGDEHSGAYGEQVFKEVQQYNERQYSDFSCLIRSTFDQALKYFEDGTVDLLHIDGLHSLEAVTHDFETWLPKLSANSIVVMHDTNVRERDFGVFKLFALLKAKYPFFEFSHGHGLGILGIGKNQKRTLEKLYQAQLSEKAYPSICEIFGRLGRACADARNLLQVEVSASQLGGDLEKNKAQFDELKRNYEKRVIELNEKSKLLSEYVLKESLNGEINSLEKGQFIEKISNLKEEKEKLLSNVQAVEEANRLAEVKLSGAQEKLISLSIENTSLINRNTNLDIENNKLNEAVAQLKNELECKQESIVSLSIENKELLNCNSNLEAENNKLNEAVALLKKELSLTQEKIDSSIIESTGLINRNKSLEIENNKLNETTAQLKKEIECALDAKYEMDRKVLVLEMAIKSSETQLDKNLQAMKVASDKNEVLIENSKSLTLEIEKLNGRINFLEKNIITMENEIAALHEKNHLIQEANNKLSANLNERFYEIAKLTEQIQLLNVKNESSEIRFGQELERGTQFQIENKRLIHTLELNEVHIRNQKSMIENLENSKIELEKILRECQEKNTLITKLENDIVEIYRSTSWKITSPLRSVKKLVRPRN